MYELNSGSTSAEPTSGRPGPAEGVAPGRKPWPWLFGGTATAVAAALILVTGAVGRPPSTASLTLQNPDQGLADLYNYTLTEQLNVAPDHEFTFPAAVDHADAAQVYVDPALTRLVYSESYTIDGVLHVRPFSGDTAAMLPCHINLDTGSCDYAGASTQTLTKGGAWNLSTRYYIKLGYDAAGKTLRKPQVVLFTVRDDTAPTPTTPGFQVMGDGSVDFMWTPVPGATGYTLLRIGRDAMNGPVYSVIGNTTGTHLNTGVESGERAFLDRHATEPGTELGMQNQLLGGQLVSQTQDELLALGGNTADYDPGRNGMPQVTFAVQAHDAGGATSPLVEVPGNALLAQVPLSPALTAAGLKLRAQPCAFVDCLPVWTTVPMTMMDGRTVERPVSFAAAQPTPCSAQATIGEPCTQIDAPISGTMFHKTFYFQGATLSASDQAAINRQTALNARAIPPASSGAPPFTFTQAAAAPGAGAVTTMPPLDRPISGTTPLVQYIAANLTAGNFTMDVTDYLTAGVTLDDALGEAVLQSPQTMLAGQAAATVSVSGGRTTLQVSWAGTGTDDATMSQRRDQTIAKGAQVVAAIIKPNMTDQQKAQAISDWIVANASYSYDAWLAVRGATSDDPRELLQQAWASHPGFADASGVLLAGSALSLGYAEAFKLLADDAGLTAVVVTGVATASGEPHAWNKVRLGNQWRVVDVAWNDFGLTDAEANQTRQPDTAWVVDGLQGTFAAA